MGDLPAEVVDDAVRLTRLARRATDDAEAAAYRAQRDAALADRGFVARVRVDDGPVLVCYPAEWVSDDHVDIAAIEDLDRAVERPLAGAADPDDWSAVDAHNRALARAVRRVHGPVHGATADAFADFMGNHHGRRAEAAGARECREFLEEYLPRNAWPTDEQRAVALTSLRLVFDAAERDPPAILDDGRPSPVDRPGDGT